MIGPRCLLPWLYLFVANGSIPGACPVVAHTSTEEARVAASRGDTQGAWSSLAQVNAALHDRLQPAMPAGVLRKVKVTLSRTTRLYATWLTTSGSHQVQVSCCCCCGRLLLLFP